MTTRAPCALVVLFALAFGPFAPEAAGKANRPRPMPAPSVQVVQGTTPASPTSLSIAWPRSSDKKVRRYRVFQQVVGAQTRVCTVRRHQARSCTVQVASDGRTYRYGVTAKRRSGKPSRLVNFTSVVTGSAPAPEEVLAPSAPQPAPGPCSDPALGGTTTTFFWAAPAFSQRAIVGYEVQDDLVSESVSTQSYTHQHVADGTYAEITVRAVDSGGLVGPALHVTCQHPWPQATATLSAGVTPLSVTLTVNWVPAATYSYTIYVDGSPQSSGSVFLDAPGTPHQRSLDATSLSSGATYVVVHNVRGQNLLTNTVAF